MQTLLFARFIESLVVVVLVNGTGGFFLVNMVNLLKHLFVELHV